MPITAQCDSCSAKFKVKDQLAGKTVKCPKCAKPFTIRSAVQAKPKAAAAADEYSLAPAPVVPKHNPMLDLLDQAGVEATPRGPVCHHCGAEMPANSVICIECGYNIETGKQLETTSYADDGGFVEAGMSDAEKMLARAEQEIDESPVSADDQNFGDGADSFLLAVVCVVIALVLTGIGVGTIFVMDKIGENVNTALISMFGSMAMYLFCAIWITIVGFRAKPVHGLACLLTGGLYCIVFGFMMGRALLMPTLICLFAIVIGLISFAVAAAGSDRRTQLIEAATQFADIVTIV